MPMPSIHSFIPPDIFQDDWRVTHKLTLNLGLHWDFERPGPGTLQPHGRPVRPERPEPDQRPGASCLCRHSGQSRPIAATPEYNCSTRSGRPASSRSMAWCSSRASMACRGPLTTPTCTNGSRAWVSLTIISPNTVIRGGFGRFTQADFNTGAQFGYSRSTSLTATTDNYLTAYDTMAHPFQNGILSPTGSSLGALDQSWSSGFTWDNPNLDRFYSWEYSLHVQHEWRGWLFEAGYSHNKTYNISWGWNRTNPPLPTGSSTTRLTFVSRTAGGYAQLESPGSESVLSPERRQPRHFALHQHHYRAEPTAEPQSALWRHHRKQPYRSRTSTMPGSVKSNAASGRASASSLPSPGRSCSKTPRSEGGSQLASQARSSTNWVAKIVPFHLNIAPIWDIPVGRKQHFGGNMAKWADAIVGGGN